MPCHAVRCNLDVSVSFAWRFSDGMQSMTLEPQRHILIHYFSASDSFTPAEPEHTLTQNGKTRRQCTACTDRCVRTDLDMHQNAVVLKQIPFVGRALGSRAQCMQTTKQHMSRCNHTDRTLRCRLPNPLYTAWRNCMQCNSDVAAFARSRSYGVHMAHATAVAACTHKTHEASA